MLRSVMSELIYAIEDGIVTLKQDYKAGDSIRVKKISKGGAAYAARISHLNEGHENIINWFYLFESEDNPNQSMAYSWFRKADFSKWFLNYQGTRDLMNPGPLAARFSEMVKFGIFEQSNEIRESYLKTKEGPFYKMNWNRCKEIEKRGGLIW